MCRSKVEHDADGALEVGGVVAVPAIDHGIQGVHKQDVVAGGAKHQVGSITAIERVVAVASDKNVVSFTTIQRIESIITINAISSGAADQ